jgi:hypothetical protein
MAKRDQPFLTLKLKATLARTNKITKKDRKLGPML